MYYIAPIPSQFVDHSGVPYAGGSVSVRYAGDTDIAEIYQDAEGVSLLQNPCPLDSHGSWVCFVPAGIALDYVVMDKDGHVVFSFDNVIAASGGDGAGVTKNYVDSHDQELRVMIENLGDDISKKLDKNGDGKDVYVTFEEAQERVSIESRDTLSVLMGKIKKWFSSLKALAFKDKADLTSDVSGILPITSGGTGSGTAVGARDNLDVYSREETEALLAGKIVIVTQLPESGESGKIYYLQVEENVYDEYIWGYAPGATEKSWILTDRHEVDFDNYKTKQRPYSQTGSATKTLLSISQNANGEVEAVFGDINLPQQVPRVNIVSSGNTISVSSSENPQTNTKTFDINVDQKPLSLAWVSSGDMTYYADGSYMYANSFSLVNNGKQNPQGDKISFDPNNGHLTLSEGTYSIFAKFEISWTGTPQNKIIYIGGYPFDLSYNHSQTESVPTIAQIGASAIAVLSISIDEAPPSGLTVKVLKADIVSVQQVMENVVQGFEAVEHDNTLTGDGTSASPLSVVVDDELDEESENPVQNAAVVGAFAEVAEYISDSFNEVWYAIYGVEEDLSEL